MESNVTHGRYNEPGANGKDIYGQVKKVKDQIKKVKKASKKDYMNEVPVPAKDDFMNPPVQIPRNLRTRSGGTERHSALN